MMTHFQGLFLDYRRQATSVFGEAISMHLQDVLHNCTPFLKSPGHPSCLGVKEGGMRLRSFLRSLMRAFHLIWLSELVAAQAAYFFGATLRSTCITVSRAGCGHGEGIP